MADTAITQPDRFALKWAKERMHRMRAGTNYEAKQRMRNSSDPADHRALEILDADQAAIAADLAARKAAGLYPYERPQSVIEAERQRAEGADVTGVASVGGSSATDAGPPSLRTPAAFFAKQLDGIRTVLSRYGVPLVRVPESVSGTHWPCYAEIDDGYTATKPPLLGGPLPAVSFISDDKGIVGGTVSHADDGDDVRRADQKRLYGKRARHVAEWGSYPAISTQENARKGVDPEG